MLMCNFDWWHEGSLRLMPNGMIQGPYFNDI
jgi:hypothetical protein